ncbi:hypothetical protein BH10PSE7_BH10PSE7_27550 [soil metagenome]
MDQDTSKTPGKGSWRDRLGVGGRDREMPKLANEFKPAREGKTNAAPNDNGQRTPQIVTKTAPMAPRAPSPPQARQAEKPAQKSQPVPGQQRQGDNQDLAVRLKAQREAAEKVAHQRVSQARGRPESSTGEKPRFSFAEEEVAQARRESTPRESSPREQPSFANKLAAANQSVTKSAGPPSAPPQSAKATPQKAPPLLPPRQALGGEKPITAPPAYPTRYTPPASQGGAGTAGYRPLDPPAYQPQVNKPVPRQASNAPLNDSPADMRRPHGRDAAAPYRGRDADYGDGYQDHPRGGAAPARARTPAYNDEPSDVFEEERAPPARRRASAQDYNEAYREFDEGYGEEQGRRKGPWLLLLFLLIAAIAAGGIIYYYMTEIKPAGQVDGKVPVISAPDQPAKVDPEPNATMGQQAPGTTDAQRKQIYDRILGEDTIDGNKIVPTEQQPKAVEPSGNAQPGDTQGNNSQTGTGQPADSQPAMQAQPGANNTANPDGTVEPLPLPLPPPPGENGTQGALTNGTNQSVAAAAAKDNATSGSPQPVSAKDNARIESPQASSSAEDIIEPIPGEADGPAKPAPVKPSSEAQPKITPPAEAVQETEVITDKPVEAEKPAEVKKPAAKTASTKTKATKKTPADDQASAQEPMILVPQSETDVQGASSAEQPPATSRPLLGIFRSTGKRPAGSPTGKRRDDAVTTGPGRGNWQSLPSIGDGASNEQVSSITANYTKPADDAGQAQDAAPVQDVAPDQAAQPEPLPEAAPPEAPPAKTAAVETEPKAAGGKYVAQLASFQSKAEAMAEYNRLQSQHGDVLNGLKPTVTASNISGRFRLGVGPVATREEASNICNALISAGERDCLVRGN